MRPTIYQSFMLRLEFVEHPDENARWHSEVKHIQSGASYRFDSFAGMVAFLQRQIDSTLLQRQEEDPDHRR